MMLMHVTSIGSRMLSSISRGLVEPSRTQNVSNVARFRLRGGYRPRRLHKPGVYAVLFA